MEERKNLEISYHREMTQNYLMIGAAEESEQGFEARMLSGNDIEGLLKFRIRRTDNRCWYCYEITSRQPLSRVLEKRTVDARQIRQILLGIVQTLNRMREYLLTEQHILLDPECIYVNSESFQPELCLVPGLQVDFAEELSDLLRFLLGKTDHQDKEAVILIYGLYQESLKENYGLENLLKQLVKEGSPNMANMEDAPIFEKIEKMQEASMDAAEVFPAEPVRQEPGRGTGGDWPVRKYMPLFLLLPVISAGILWFWKGAAGLARYGLAVVGTAVLAALAGAALCVWRMRQREPVSEEKGAPAAELRKDASWEMVFAEDEPVMPREQTPLYQPAAESKAQQGEFHTTLLYTRRPQQESIHYLVGEEGTKETIPISYYPFLIGKQENLADFVLREETISRLHARIDRRNETYWLTDLNSTNGTSINGKVLEANETAMLQPGDQIALADMHFRFQ